MKYRKYLFLICLFLLSCYYMPNSIAQAQVDKFDSTNISSDEEFTDVDSMSIKDTQSPHYNGQGQIGTVQEDFQSGFFHGTSENIHLSYNGAQLGIDGEEGGLESDCIPAPISFFALSLKINAVVPKDNEVEVYVRVSPDSYNWGCWLLLGKDNFRYDYEGDLFYSNSQVSNEEAYFLQYRIKLIGKGEDKPTIRNVVIEFTNPGDIHVIIAEQEAREKEQEALAQALKKKVYLVPSIEYSNLVCSGTNEGYYQNIIANKIKDILSPLYEVNIFDGTSWSQCGCESPDNGGCCQVCIGKKANIWGADVLVSFHTNALKGGCNGTAFGTLTFYECYNNDYVFAEKIHNAVLKSLKPLRDKNGIPNNNMGNKHWWQWRSANREGCSGYSAKNCETSAYTPCDDNYCDLPDWYTATMPACLIESLFHDNIKEAAILVTDEGQTAIAQGIANGIMEFFGGSSNLPNLTPYKPSGWSDKIVVSNTTGTTNDSSPLYTTDTLYIDWSVINNGTASTNTTFYSRLYVDGVERQSWYTPPLNVNYSASVEDYSIGTLSAGTHYIKIITDATGAVQESDESDNEYTKTITVHGTCTYTISPTSRSHGSGSETGSISVTTNSSICSWQAYRDDSWITITSDSSGTGNGTVYYSVSANSSGSTRTGTITIYGAYSYTFTVTQAGDCASTYGIAPTSQTFSASAGTGSVTVTAGSSCSWTAVSNATWITITSGSSGTGNGTVTYAVSANTGASQRTGTMTIAGKTFTVNQSGIQSDTISPTVEITSPTAESTYTTTSGSIDLGGTASDYVGVTQVDWTNDRGGNGTANGTTNWSVNGITLQSGVNVVTVTARDAANNTGTDAITVTYSDGISLGEAVDNTSLTWTTGGDANWYGQDSDFYYGGDSAMRGDILDSQASWIQTTVAGTGTLTFYWKVSSEVDYDFLKFYMDGNLQTQISGEESWQQNSYSISSGSHTLKWEYEKNANVSYGSDAGWLDYVVFTGSGYQTRSSMYRFYNIITGTHFYTISEEEKDSVMQNLPQYHYEGIAYYAYTTSQSGTLPMYRFYNVNTGTHFYTISEEEKNSVIQNLPQYHYEGIAYYAYTTEQ